MLRQGGEAIVFATPATNAGCPIYPDFLRRLVALLHPMRLSLMKGAHADLSSTAWQEIGVKPYFACPGVPWGLSGIMALDVPLSDSDAHSTQEGSCFIAPFGQPQILWQSRL